MYNGNPKPEKGAVVIRTAESFLRFGHFELLSAQREYDSLQKLADFTIENYFPEITSSNNQRYKTFFENICTRTADLIVEWFRVGFVHGVMNTDNMSILELTIDYGPYAMLEEYNLNFPPNITDLPGRRYAFGRQGQIAQWNLWKLANTLLPLIKDKKFLENTLNNFETYFWRTHDQMLCKKFGFDQLLRKDKEFFINWQRLMQELLLDYTLFFNQLNKLTTTSDTTEVFKDISYTTLSIEMQTKLHHFIRNYVTRLRLNSISREDSLAIMEKANPKFILRNYLLYKCIEEISNGKKEMLHKLIKALENPYQEIYPEFSAKRPSKYDNIAGYSMLSCSSW